MHHLRDWAMGVPTALVPITCGAEWRKRPFDNIYKHLSHDIVHLGAVRNYMSKLYEQRQLVEPRDWDNSSRERPAIGGL